MDGDFGDDGGFGGGADCLVKKVEQAGAVEHEVVFERGGGNVDVEGGALYPTACGVAVYARADDFGPQVAEASASDFVGEIVLAEKCVDYFSNLFGINALHCVGRG